MTKEEITCDICGSKYIIVRDCVCQNGWHYEGGSLVRLCFSDPLKYRFEEFHIDHDSEYFDACYKCQEQVIARIKDGTLYERVFGE